MVEGLTSGVMFKWRTGPESLDLQFVVERQQGTVAALNFMAGFIPMSPEMPGQDANSAYVWLDSSTEAGVGNNQDTMIWPLQHRKPARVEATVAARNDPAMGRRPAP